ncbi:MAG: hypothetical protein K2I64_03080 [Muribaculaceae bacterium]|nr:hypothetical protein [Muribaculaceae bacterium]
MVITADILNSQPEAVRKLFLHWAPYLYERVRFNMPDSRIHAMAHCERVLLHALSMGYELMPDNPRAIEALAHAAIFHDTRRLDEYLDTGHGARGAVYYSQYCADNADIDFDERAAYMMRYHDLDDSVGVKAIEKRWGIDSPEGRKAKLLYAIFKDADALDRWRLGSLGLDPKYLRTDAARSRVEYARDVVAKTMDPDVLREIDEAVRASIEAQKKS